MSVRFKEDVLDMYWRATDAGREDIKRTLNDLASDELPTLSREGRAEIMQRQLMQKSLPDQDGYDEVREQFDLGLLRDLRCAAGPEQFEQARI